ncbi:MAG: hypothetical protein GY745_06285 [Actinomycetia bacterium]|nr:hypothetical protein [Actinomycetes bacterium]
MIMSLATTPAYAACGSNGIFTLDDLSLDHPRSVQTRATNGSFASEVRWTNNPTGPPPAGDLPYYAEISGGVIEFGCEFTAGDNHYLEYYSPSGTNLIDLSDCSEIVIQNVTQGPVGTLLMGIDDWDTHALGGEVRGSKSGTELVFSLNGFNPVDNPWFTFWFKNGTVGKKLVASGPIIAR